MLQSLYIKNYAIIDETLLKFPDSLTAITGETGSGKSILLGALGLILGNRADTDKLYRKDQKCIVEAQFIVDRSRVEQFFADHDFDYENPLILRREINTSGKSRAFINDTPALLKEIRVLSKSLIQIHQQFDTMDITESSYQLKLLDALAENGEILLEYRQIYASRKQVLEKISNLKNAFREAQKEQDYIAFQLKEIEELNLNKEEIDSLDAEYTQLQNADEIIALLSALTSNLTGESHSIVERLRNLRNELSKLDKYLPQGSEILHRLQAGILELEDLSESAYEIGESIESDPNLLEEYRIKIDKIQHLLKKHQLDSYGEIFTLQEELSLSLSSIENTESEIINCENELKHIESQLHTIATELHKKRKSVIPVLVDSVKTQLKLLAMPHAQFHISLEKVSAPIPDGMDRVEFLFNANKGGDVHALKQVASGGEMSRLALVLNSLVAKSMTLPTMIFDEIDSGVSGDVALKMGKIIKALSDNHQIIIITHSPQIAAQGDLHYYVYKKVDEKRTYAIIEPVKNEERIKKIAIMLSQNPPTEAAQKNAEELLNYKYT